MRPLANKSCKSPSHVSIWLYTLMMTKSKQNSTFFSHMGFAMMHNHSRTKVCMRLSRHQINYECTSFQRHEIKKSMTSRWVMGWANNTHYKTHGSSLQLANSCCECWKVEFKSIFVALIVLELIVLFLNKSFIQFRK